MSIYVMSDIHGHYDEFMDMINRINFSDEDTLYILGDVMEYDNNPLDIIDYIIGKENIILLKGNQEDIFINEVKNIIELDYFVGSLSDNKGIDNTIDMIARRGKEYAIKLRDYLINLPFIKVIDKYILVHGDFKLPNNYKALTIDELVNVQDEHNSLYGRSFVMDDTSEIEGWTIILGHTIVMIFDRSNEHILHKKGKILLDCGAAINRNLSCLRLDDMKEFYVKIKK